MISYLHQMISSAARRRPSAIAIMEPSRSITYGELGRKIEGLSGYLSGKGLKKGERVCIISRNSIEFVVMYFAVSRAGGVTVPLNYTAGASILTSQIKDCSPAVLYYGKGMETRAGDIVKKTRSIRFTVSDKDIENMPDPAKLFKTRAQKIASIIYTSGTTGKPLGVVLSHRNLISNSSSIVKYMRLKPSDRICCVLPLYYIYGLSLLLSHFLAGAAVILDNRFAYPNVILDAIDRFKATGFAGVSSHYAILLNSSIIKDRKLPSLTRFLQAGDRMPEALTKALLSIFPRKKLYLMYGQTEASPRLTYLDPALAGKKPGSVGRAIPGVEVKIVNEAGRECGPGEEGEIIANGSNIMAGYWRNREETKKVIKNGWLYTSDIAFSDKDGDVFITGRKKSFIKIGGHRVNPLKIESAAMDSGKIAEAAAVPTVDRWLGSRIKLFVAMAKGAKPSADYILRQCRKKLSTHEVPSEVVFLPSLPKNDVGKIDRESLK